MTREFRTWLVQQLKGLALIIGLSLLLAVSVNTFRKDSIPWIDARRSLEAGDTFPHFPVPSTIDRADLEYLGLPPDKEMSTISNIQADLLVVEILNVYCFACQSQALALNEVYKSIANRPNVKGQIIKIIGMAIGNTQEDVDDFRERYGLLFPIIPDSAGLSARFMGPDVAPPFCLYIRRVGSGKLGLVAGTHGGVIEDDERLLKGLDELCKMEPGSVRFGELFLSEH